MTYLKVDPKHRENSLYIWCRTVTCCL